MKLLFQLFILLLPTQLAYHFWPDFAFVFGIRVDYLAPAVYLTELLWVSIFLLWVARDRSVLPKILSNWKWLLVLVVFAGINIFASEMAVVAIYKWLRLLEFFSLYFFVKSQKGILGLIKLPLLVSLTFLLFLSLGQIINGASIGGVFYWIGERSFSQASPGIALANFLGRETLRPYATFGHPNALAGYALVSLFLFPKNKMLFLVSSLIVLISFSQNAWLALFATPVIFYFAKKINGYAKFVRVTAVASFFLTLLKPSGLPRELLQRVELNVASGNIISQNPLFGVGLGGFIAQLPSAVSSRPIWFLQPVHNIFLLITVETGLVGLLLFVYFMGRNINGRNALPVIAIVLTGLFDHYWLTLFQNMMLAAVVFGCYNAKDENIL